MDHNPSAAYGPLVDTIVRPPAAAHPTLGERPGRRWIRWVILALTICSLALVIGGSVWVANYDPFAPGMRLWHPQDERIRVVDVEGLGASGRVFEFLASGRAQFIYTFSITNTGPVAVTIERVGPPRDQQRGELKRRPIRIVEDEFAQGEGELIFDSWHPFVLRPGQQANIEMEVNFNPEICLPRGTSLVWWPETISFSVFGIQRTTTFESNLDVHVVGTRDCPES